MCFQGKAARTIIIATAARASLGAKFGTFFLTARPENPRWRAPAGA